VPAAWGAGSGAWGEAFGAAAGGAFAAGRGADLRAAPLLFLIY
jgi:hypothetical protein